MCFVIGLYHGQWDRPGEGIEALEESEKHNVDFGKTTLLAE